MAAYTGKLLDIIGLIPIGKLAKIGKVIETLDQIKALKKAAEAIKKGLKSADDLADAARKGLGQAEKGRDATKKTFDELIKKREADFRKKFADELDKLKDANISEAESIRRATEATQTERRLAREAQKAKKRALEAEDQAVARETKKLKDAEAQKKKAETDLADNQGIIADIIVNVLGLIFPVDLIKCLIKALGVVALAVSYDDKARANLDGVMLAGTSRALEDDIIVLADAGFPVDATLTGPGGYFEFDNLHHGEYQLITISDALRVRRCQIQADSNTFFLQGAGGNPLAIQILEDQEPVAGAQIFVAELFENRIQSLIAAETEPSGIAPIQVPSINSQYVVLAGIETDHGYTMLAPRLIEAYDPCGCVIYQLPASGISGQILDAGDGQPIEGAVITIVPTENGEITEDVAKLSGARVVTDREGNFTAPYLDSGDWAVIFYKEGYLPKTCPLFAGQDQLTSLAAVSLEAAAATGDFRGRLLDPVGRPTSGYIVVNNAAGQPIGHRVFTDRAGTFSINSLPVGDYRLDIQGAVSGHVASPVVSVTSKCPVPVDLCLQFDNPKGPC